MKLGTSTLVKVFLLFFIIIFAFKTARPTVGPRAFLEEEGRAYFFSNGSLVNSSIGDCDGNPCRFGGVQVSVPNNQSVLQQVRVNLSSGDNPNESVDNTNLSSRTAYKGALASYPDSGSKSPLYLNSSVWGSDSVHYHIYNESLVPVINLSLTYQNQEGGIDLYDADNLEGMGGSDNIINFTFEVENPSDFPLVNVTAELNFDVDTNNDTAATEDSLTIMSNMSASTGNVSATDSNWNAEDETFEWSGDLSSGQTAEIWFLANVTETYHWEDDTEEMNFDAKQSDKGGITSYWNIAFNSVFTGTNITGMFAKSSIRQATDMIEQKDSGIWQVRGFIKNIGPSVSGNDSVITYNVSYWALYNVSSTTGEPDVEVASGNFTNNGSLGKLITPTSSKLSTDWENTSKTAKPYYASQFDWEVVWNSTNSNNYLRALNSFLDLPTLYKLDMEPSVTDVGSVQPSTPNSSFTVECESELYSHNQTPVDFINITSIVPTNTTTGKYHGPWEINTSSITIEYHNGSYYDITNESGVNYTWRQPTTTQPGEVHVNISNLTQVPLVGRPLTAPSDKIKLDYDALTDGNMTAGDEYRFSANFTFKSQSGTPLRETTDMFVPVAAKRLLGYKDVWAPNPNQPNLVNVTIRVEMTAQEGNITGIVFMDYIPNGTSFNTSDINVRFYDNNSWQDWENGTDYELVDEGYVTLPDGSGAHAYEYQNATGDGNFTMWDGQIIEANYQMNITQSGIYELPATIYGLDPATGRQIANDVVGAIRVKLPEPLKDPKITEGELQPAKRIQVGNPVLWVKKLEVYNPNSRPITPTFESKIFPDVMRAYISYYDLQGRQKEEDVDIVTKEGKKYARWSSRLQASESRSYEVRVLTSPVVETDRDVKVLEQIDDERVRLKMDIYLKNLGDQSYEDVFHNLNIPYDAVEEVRDGYGNQLKFTGDSDSTRVQIGDVKGSGLKTISVIYKRPFPTIIVTPERERYNPKSPVQLNVLVINGGEPITSSHLETNILSPGMDVLYSDIKQIEALDPMEETELTERYVIPAQVPPGKYTAAVSFRKGTETLASSTGNFYVEGTGGGLWGLGQIIIYGVSALLVYLTWKRLKEILKIRKSTGR